jgi:hypothetical protein
MKRFLIFIILLSAIYAKGQVHVIRTNGTITPVDFDGSFRYSLKIPVVADTTSAFSHGGIDSLGLVIQVRSTGDWWKRDTVTGGGHKWTKFGAGGGSGTVNVSNSIVGDGSSGTPLNLSGDASAPGNSQYYGTNSSGTKGYNSLNKAAVGLPNADNTSDVNKPVSTAQATAIGLKIANFLNVTFLGYGPHAARPTTGPGLYYDTDSSSLFFVNTGVYSNLFPAFTMFLRSQAPGAAGDTSYIQAVGGNLLIAPFRDSAGSCIHHVVNPDGSYTWYSTCGTGSGFDSLTSQGGVFHTGAYNDSRYNAKMWTKAGNYLYPINTTDSVGVGTATPTANFSVVGKVDQTLADTTNTAGTRVANSLIVRLNGNPGTSSVNYAWNLQFASLGSTVHGKFNAVNINYDNAPGFLGTLNTANGIEFNPGNIGQVGTFTGLQLNDGNGTAGYNGIFSAMSAGTGKLFINHNGTAPSKFMGPIGINTGSPDASAWLDIPGTSKGVLIPRGTTAQRNAITSPATGLLFFNLDSAGSGRALQYYTGSAWIAQGGIGSGGGIAAGTNKQVQINNSGAFGVVPNFTADVATGLVNADSITAHKIRSDSLKLNLSVQANRGFGGATKYFQAGNSIAFGTASTVFDSSFVACNGRLFQLAVIDSGVSGTRTPEIASMLLRNVNYPNTYVTSIEGGYNNGRNTNVINNRNTLNNIVYSFKAAWWNQFAGPVQNATSGTGVTRTGTWTTGYGGILNAGGKTNGVAYTSSAGAYIEYAFTDSTVGALCEIPTSTASSITVSIDGSVVQTLNPTGKFDGLGAYLSVSYGMFPIIVTGLSNAAHTLRITNVSGGLFLVDCFTNFVPANSANSMALIFYHVPHQNTAGYALNPTYSQAAADTINSKIDSLAAFLPSAWPLYVAKTNTRYDVTTGLSADNIHPNNTGMKQWSLAAADAVNGTPPAPGTIFAQFNPDGSFAGFYAQSEKTGQKNKIAFTTTNGLQDIIINNPTMTTDNVINGAGYKMSFINFLKLVMDSTKMTPGALVQNGVISAVGPAATVRVGNRGADTTQRGFEWYASGNKISWYDEFSNRNMASGDTSLRFGFFTDPTEGNFNSSNLSAAVHIGGNLQGRAAHAPLKMNFGSLMATPEKGAFEPDSLGGGLWWTKKNGTRVRIDSPTVTAASIPPNIGTGYRIYAPQTPGFKSFVFVNGSIDSTSTSNVLTFKSGSGQGASDADYTATNGATSISLPVITANRTLTVPNANAANTGAFMSIMNNNTAAFTWNVATGGGAGQLRDMNATDITTLLNKTIYFFTNNGSYWILTGTQRIAPAGFDVSGSYSSTGTATTTFTVTMGVTQPNTTYKVGFAPTDALSAAPYYITNKTTTTFDVVYLSGLTGVVSFDWTVTP